MLRAPFDGSGGSPTGGHVCLPVTEGFWTWGNGSPRAYLAHFTGAGDVVWGDSGEEEAGWGPGGGWMVDSNMDVWQRQLTLARSTLPRVGQGFRRGTLLTAYKVRFYWHRRSALENGLVLGKLIVEMALWGG